MLYSLGRESQSAAEWTKAVAPVLQEAAEFPVEGFSRFVGAWSAAVADVGRSELYARKAERYKTFGVGEGVADDAGARFEKLNSRGVEGLRRARKQLADLGEGLAEYDKRLRDSGRDIPGELDDYRTELFEHLADVEMKHSDAQQLRELVDEAVDAAKKGGLAGVAEFGVAQLDRAVEARESDGRGADTNFAVWKLVAVIALLVALGIAFTIHCGVFSCSVSSKNNYIAAILTVAGLWWC